MEDEQLKAFVQWLYNDIETDLDMLDAIYQRARMRAKDQDSGLEQEAARTFVSEYERLTGDN